MNRVDLPTWLGKTGQTLLQADPISPSTMVQIPHRVLDWRVLEELRDAIDDYLDYRDEIGVPAKAGEFGES